MQKFFYTELSYCKERRQSFVIPFTADIRNWLYLLKLIFLYTVLRARFILLSALFLEAVTKSYSLK